MTQLQELHVGDVGAIIQCRVVEHGAVVDVSSATQTKTLRFLKPDGTVVAKSAVFATDGTDGLLWYVTEAGFLDVEGHWSVQPYVEINGWSGFGKEWRFYVNDVIPEPPN